MKKIGSWVLGCLLATALVAPAHAADEANKPIRIGVIGPYSGGSASMGISMLHAVRLAVSEVNWKGGLLGRPVQLVERDDEANPAKGDAAARELVEKDKVDAVLGIANTGVGLLALKRFQQAKIPVIVNMAAGAPLTQLFAPPKLPDSYVFRLAASDKIQTERLVGEVVNRMKLSKVALLCDTTPYGAQGLELLRSELAERGLKPVFEGSFSIGQTDMRSLITQAHAAGAQALMVWGIGPELAAIAKERTKQGLKIPMLGSWTLSLDNFIKGAGKAGDGAKMTQTFIAEPITSRRQEFLISFRKQSKMDAIPSAVSAAQGYDSVLVLAAAIKQANSVNGTAVRNALENLKAQILGVVTTYDRPYSHTSHEAFSEDMVVTGEVRDGRVVFAHKEEINAVILGKRSSARH